MPPSFHNDRPLSRGRPCGMSCGPEPWTGSETSRRIARARLQIQRSPARQRISSSPPPAVRKAVASARRQCMAMPRTPIPRRQAVGQRDAVGERPVSLATTAPERAIAPATSRAPIRAFGYAGQSSRYRTRRCAFPVHKRIPFLFLLRYQVRWLIDPSIPD
jgi:hypothetical protein